MHHIERERAYDAPAPLVWDVMTDPDVYPEVAPTLTHVEVLSGSEEGMVRRCTDTDGNVWTETCTHWTDGERFAVEVDVANSDFHRRLFTHFAGEWTLTERPDDVLATTSFTYAMKYGPLGRLLARFMAPKARSMVDAICDGWQTEIQRRLVEATRDTDTETDAITGQGAESRSI